jgi:hypothetical protein
MNPTGAAGVAAHLPGGAGDALTGAARGAFTDAIGLALLVGSGVALAGAVLVKRYLPTCAAQRRRRPASLTHQTAASRLEAHTEHPTQSVEARGTA